jgi:hypothetical protein
MGETFGLPPINEIVGVLSSTRPEILASARVDLPQYASSFEPGEVAGDNDVDEQFRHRVLVKYAALAKEAIQDRIELCRRARVEAQRRLLRASSLRFTSQVVAVFGSGSAVGTLPLATPLLTAIAASMGLVGSVFAILADRYGSSPLKGTKLTVVYEKCVEINERARTVLAELCILTESDSVSDKTMEKVVAEANCLCADTANVISESGLLEESSR